jgi:hypothetical protein
MSNLYFIWKVYFHVGLDRKRRRTWIYLIFVKSKHIMGGMIKCDSYAYEVIYSILSI